MKTFPPGRKKLSKFHLCAVFKFQHFSSGKHECLKVSHSFKKNWPHCVILILTFTISSNADTEYSKKEKEYFNHSKSPYSYFFMCFSPFHKMFAFLNVNGKAFFYFLSLSTVCSVVI